jgi:hypothetical protein
MVYYHLFLFVPKVLEARAARGLGSGYSFGDDFYPIWLTSREALLHDRDPYSPGMTRQIQIGLFGRVLDRQHPLDPPPQYREFAYPAFVDIVFWPVAYLPFSVVRLGLAILLPPLTAAGIFLWMKGISFRASPNVAVSVVLLTLCSYPILEGLFAEQVGLVVGFFAAAGLAALAAGKHVTAGWLLALATIKPQMVVMLICFLLLWSVAKWRERRRFAETFAAIEILLCMSASLIWPRWVQNWLAVLFNYHTYSTPPLVVELLGGKLGALLGPPLIAIFLAITILVAWRARIHSTMLPAFWLAVALILSITVVAILPGQAVYDHIMLLPGIILAVRFRRQIASGPRLIRWLFWVSAFTLFWQWMAAAAILVIRPFISSEQFYSVGVFSLPIRMAGSFPFALFAMLGAIMAGGLPRMFAENGGEEGRARIS